ncbi:MAG: GlsB/YeaQ/YmgE family stress response membrane protein [Prevotella sp.]|nr:GlsB/YeaQ/YmgE family stress response membrane protein [Prevotella sp.]
MFDHISQFTTWPILTGIVIGYIANRIMSGEGKGCCMNLFIGVVGSYVGAFIGSLFNVNLAGAGYFKNFVFCVIGSIAVLWLWDKLSGKK